MCAANGKASRLFSFQIIKTVDLSPLKKRGKKCSKSEEKRGGNKKTKPLQPLIRKTGLGGMWREADKEGFPNP